MTTEAKRIDYYDDSNAPQANSIKPSANALVLRDGTILLTRRSDNGNWSMPGGAQDPGESLTQTAIRETLEESGTHIRSTGVAGIHTDPKYVVHYTSNDEVRQEFTIVYRADYISGEPAPSDETTDVKWVPIDQLDKLPMDRSQRMRIDYGLSQTGTRIDPPGA